MRRKLSSFVLTQDILRHLLHYDPLTGEWTWVHPLPRSKVRPGDRAGRITTKGHRQLRIASQFYVGSRLAWFYTTGKWPEYEIDHINRVKHDDRWDNLREATRSQNAFNRDWCETSGELRGIYCCGKQFRVDVGGQYLGLYPILEEAIAVRDKALKELAGPFAVIERKTA